jgi:hypothetical protein
MGREAAGKYGVHDGGMLQTTHFPTSAGRASESTVDTLSR